MGSTISKPQEMPKMQMPVIGPQPPCRQPVGPDREAWDKMVEDWKRFPAGGCRRDPRDWCDTPPKFPPFGPFPPPPMRPLPVCDISPGLPPMPPRGGGWGNQ